MKIKSFTLALVVAQLSASTLKMNAGDPPAVPAPTPATATTNVTGPHIQFSATSFNFDRIRPTDNAQHDFIFTNTGQAVLEITDVRPGCGCTTAGAWDRQVQPGKTGKIPLSFNPANFNGPITKGATVTCNAPGQGSIYLQFQATVWHPIDLQPQYLYFMPIEDEITSDTKVVRIVNNLDEAVTLEAPHSSNPAFQTALKTVRPGKEFELRVTGSGPVPNTSSQGTITIQTSSTNLPMLSLSAAVMPPQPALVVMPPQIQLPPGPFSPDYRYVVTIRNNGRAAVALSEPLVNVEGVTPQLQEVEPGKVFKLSLAFPPNFHPLPDQAAEATVKTTHPKHPALRVPITQSVPVAAAVPAGPGVN